MSHPDVEGVKVVDESAFERTWSKQGWERADNAPKAELAAAAKQAGVDVAKGDTKADIAKKLEG